ncbi:hypothetical protein [Propionivibrio dicarboxylicus]|uniref:hypothetical protein n=1 Tax=Propionivibrio dicarboxylicus TaxID=83767 RepID=UPI00115FD8D0|nr:hypothetical protein [Propionivibrio dicarboxylicus]
MTTEIFANSALSVAQVITTVPIFVAALVGAIPVLLLCVTCRCCKSACATTVGYIRDLCAKH